MAGVSVVVALPLLLVWVCTGIETDEVGKKKVTREIPTGPPRYISVRFEITRSQCFPLEMETMRYRLITLIEVHMKCCTPEDLLV